MCGKTDKRTQYTSFTDLLCSLSLSADFIKLFYIDSIPSCSWITLFEFFTWAQYTLMVLSILREPPLSCHYINQGAERQLYNRRVRGYMLPYFRCFFNLHFVPHVYTTKSMSVTLNQKFIFCLWTSNKAIGRGLVEFVFKTAEWAKVYSTINIDSVGFNHVAYIAESKSMKQCNELWDKY